MAELEVKKETRGGPRLGTGPKPKYNEATTTVAFRVPVSKKEKVKDLVKSYLDLYRNPS